MSELFDDGLGLAQAYNYEIDEPEQSDEMTEAQWEEFANCYY